MTGRWSRRARDALAVAAALAGPAAYHPQGPLLAFGLALAGVLLLDRWGAPRRALLALAIAAFVGPAQIEIGPGLDTPFLLFLVSAGGHVLLARRLLAKGRGAPLPSRRAAVATTAILLASAAFLLVLASVPAVETLVTTNRFQATAAVVLAAAGGVAATLLVPAELDPEVIRP